MEMDFDNKVFTETVLTSYAELLQRQLPRAKFMLHEGEGVTDAIDSRVLRLVHSYEPWGITFTLDTFIRGDGSINQEILAPAVAEGLSRPVIDAATSGLKPEDDDPLKRIGSGQLWVLHKVTPTVATFGGAQVHFASSQKIGVFGQTWYDNATKKNLFLAKIVWGLARSGEAQKH